MDGPIEQAKAQSGIAGVSRYSGGSDLEKLGEEDRVRRYTEYYLETRPALKAYLHAYLGANDAAIEDCIQETGIVVWNKWDEAWDLDGFQKFSYVTARFKALSWLKKHKPAKHMTLSPSVMDGLAERSSEMGRDDRLESLKYCMENLSPEHRQVLEARYEKESSKALSQLAAKMGRSVDAVYKQLERLRTILKDCVDKRSREQQNLEGGVHE
ncbi:sigma-70 family RNA polymerase sigma factor [Rubritalea marina]|uniref:sigma-70 family RNA polymerase sigma factor n=1 Tax=Rubritalea marina TaxID=361055 RepID=UPI00036BC92F|nr:sigma-70 family RNA polymerase sigma factor [Rubritalea marina]